VPKAEPEAEFITHSAEETVEMGRRLARRLTAPVLVLLSGDLGSGKTTLTKGIISGLGAAREEDVTSPTFTLVHIFHNPGPNHAPHNPKVYHVDLYRIEDFHGFETLGLEDAFADPAIVIVEWSERFHLSTDWPRVMVRLEHREGDTRRITISADRLPDLLADLAPDRAPALTPDPGRPHTE
jgi:tRNA threonylcarbamoyladenosine biosynthesis protein TsaE